MADPVQKAVPQRRYRDTNGIILDMLDDIIKAETKAEELIRRIDKISKGPTFRVIDLLHLGLLALILGLGIFLGFLIGRLTRS